MKYNISASNPDVSGPFASQGYNLIGDGTGASGFTATGDQVGGGVHPVIDPKLGPLQNNGGPTLTRALLPGSPAIDAGGPAVFPATDQRGHTRPQDGDGNGTALLDIGAFERDDTTAPAVESIARVGASPTNASTVQYSLTFSEPVSGVDGTDFSLTTSGVTGATITSVTGSDSTYTVTVSTGTGAGTLTLNLIDNDSITDQAGNSLGGTGAGNGSFTGPTYTTFVMEMQGTNLVIIGTTGPDSISIGPGTSPGTTRAVIDGISGVFNGVPNVIAYGQGGGDTFTVSSWKGQATLSGGAGTDRVVLVRGGNLILTNGRLTVSATNYFTLGGIEAATLMGGAAADRFTVSGWSGTADINGGGGIDTIVAAGNANFTLTNSRLTRSTGGTFNLSSIERAYLTGGAGNNILDASTFSLGGVVLVGLGGNDILKSGAQRDILIGGLGADILNGSRGDDILVAGYTSYDGNTTALDRLMQEWSRTDASYAVRRNHLLGTLAGGKNGGYRLNRSTVRGDHIFDRLIGGLSTDWFLALASEALDRRAASGETLTATS